ncbi:LicD family protein [Olivibacter sp. CPCC 100613]|uniref:LicD family protein n=1 Tax=Olivibacter sp. CPCC 100613 TaxID=3079931 RepID=UPI002FF8B439
MRKQFGFDLSTDESWSYAKHWNIWNYIHKKKVPYAVILERNVSISVPLQNINQYIREKRTMDWDVIFPFDKLQHVNIEMPKPCFLGIHWGMDVYFISLNGAKKLMEKAVLRQGVDEEVLKLSADNEIDVYIDPLNFFDIKDVSLDIPFCRKQEIFKSLMTTPRFSDRDLKLVREILTSLSSLASRFDFKLILFAGSLLGHIRHGGIIPWDDDVDLALDIMDLHKLLTALEYHNDLILKEFTFGKQKWKYYKVWSKSGIPIAGYKHTFPFVDIWLFNRDSHSIKYVGGEIFPMSYCEPYKKVLFENAEYFIPFDSLSCLDIHFPKWREIIKRDSFCHRNEIKRYLPIELDICCNDEGQIIGLQKGSNEAT